MSERGTTLSKPKYSSMTDSVQVNSNYQEEIKQEKISLTLTMSSPKILYRKKIENSSNTDRMEGAKKEKTHTHVALTNIDTQDYQRK